MLLELVILWLQNIDWSIVLNRRFLCGIGKGFMGEKESEGGILSVSIGRSVAE